MNKYEMMYIVKATMESDQVKKTAENIKHIASDLKGEVIEFKELGEKKLAYPIKKEISGYYYVMVFKASKEAKAELTRKINLDENVIRHLIVKLDEE